ncbi:MAG: lysophospholipid acyltransferase family protein [Granulosicoccus sp.]|nr:lysophospholipid acyltransferase family protein [Granulosicoccus sp.]
MSFKQRRRQLAARIFPPLVWGLIQLIWKTCRVEAVIGEEHMDTLLAAETPFIPCYWHQQQIFCIRYLLDRAAADSSLKLGYLISPSADGDMATSMFGNQGVHIIRGSATRGGAQALREIYQCIRQDGVSPIVTPDGPTGPIYRTKPGVPMLAQLSRAPLLPLAYQATGVWHLRSWDRFMLPRPFSRVVIALEAPLDIDKEDSKDGFDSACLQLDERLNKASSACRNYLSSL